MHIRPPAVEIDALDIGERIKYSVCTLVTQHDQYQEMLDSFRAGGFTPSNSEFLYVDNSQANKYDSYSAINRFLHLARGDYIILCHQDIRLHSDKLEVLDRRINELDALDPRWAVLGNAGGMYPGGLAIRITDPSGNNIHKGNLPVRVVSLDENFIVVRRSRNLSVSHDLKGFHFYGTDLCVIAGILGYTCYVVDFHLWHIGGESQQKKSRDQAFRSDYHPSRRRFIEKYRRAFAPRWIQNTGTVIFVSGSRVMNYIANRKVFQSVIRRREKKNPVADMDSRRRHQLPAPLPLNVSCTPRKFTLNWQAVKNLTHVQLGTFLALLIVAVMPNFGLKYAASPALPAAMLALLGGWLVWKQRVAMFAAPSTRHLTIVFLLLLVPVLISIPTSYDMRGSSFVAMALVVYYFSGLALVRVLRGDAERAWLAKWILFILVFWIVDSLIQYIFKADLFGIPIADDFRVLGPFKASLRQPLLISLLLPVALWVSLRKGALLALIFFTAAGFIATLSSVRMVLVMLGIVAAGLYIKVPSRRFKIPATLLACAIVLAAIGLTPAMKERMNRIAELHDSKFETLDTVLSTRATIWETASYMLIARPLTGVGAGAFAKAYNDHATRPNDSYRGDAMKVHHAHQVYFAMAAETGWPGLIGLIFAIGLCVKWYREAPLEKSNQAWPYALGLVVYFFPINTQPPLYHGNWLFPVILLLFATMLAALDGEPSTKDTGMPKQL